MAEPMQVGFIGLGQMGGPMAERLLGPDVALHVFDPAAKAAARLTGLGDIGHPDPASVANAATVVLSCLPSPAVSETVALGPDGIAAGQAVRTYVEMSTIGRQTVGRIADGLAGQVMKLVNNLVAAANMASTFEALVLGASAGLDADAMAGVLNASTGRSVVSAEMVPRSVLTGRFNFGATIAIMERDVALGLAEAAELRVPLQVLAESARLWRSALDAGRGADDITALIRVMEEGAGVAVCGAGASQQASDR